YLPERQAMVYDARRPHGLDLALSVIASTGVAASPSIGAAPKVLDGTADVFDALIQSRGLMLEELAARATAMDTSFDPQDAPLIAQAVRARQRFADLVVRSLQEPDPRSASRLNEARRQKEEAERALAERSAQARAELARAQIGLGKVRDALPAQAAL